MCLFLIRNTKTPCRRQGFSVGHKLQIPSLRSDLPNLGTDVFVGYYDEGLEPSIEGFSNGVVSDYL